MALSIATTSTSVVSDFFVHNSIVVLSNNDGGVVSRSNYTLYGDLSHRVMSIVKEHIPQQEIYSIDECFVRFDPRDDYLAISNEQLKVEMRFPCF